MTAVMTRRLLTPAAVVTVIVGFERRQKATRCSCLTLVDLSANLPDFSGNRSSYNWAAAQAWLESLSIGQAHSFQPPPTTTKCNTMNQ